MASVSSYTFDNMSRIGNDSCCIDQNTIQNVASCNYMTQNYFASDCSMKNPINLATTQPGIMYNGGYNVGAGGCNIDNSSKLQIGTIQTHPRCHIDLFQRPFATVPYLGRGPSNSILESQIKQGDTVTNRKSVNTTSEMSYMPYSNYPLIPSIESTVSNPANLVEGVAADGWIRGGLPSRNLTRDQDYAKHHNPYQY